MGLFDTLFVGIAKTMGKKIAKDAKKSFENNPKVKKAEKELNELIRKEIDRLESIDTSDLDSNTPARKKFRDFLKTL